MVHRVRSHNGAPFGLADRAKRLTGEDRFWIAALTVIFGLLVASGFLHAPYYADSMVYHLARVEHWIQNGSVAFFATHYLAQVEFSPLSEYNLAHLHLLSGSDRFDACMELLGALVSIVGVSELARLLGGSRSTKIAASVISATIPSGILLATSTDNDYFAGSHWHRCVGDSGNLLTREQVGVSSHCARCSIGAVLFGEIHHGPAPGPGCVVFARNGRF